MYFDFGRRQRESQNAGNLGIGQCPTALQENHLGYCYHFAAAAGAALGDMEKALQLLRAAERKTTLARMENAAKGAI